MWGKLPGYKLTSPQSNEKITETRATNAIYGNFGQDDIEEGENTEDQESPPYIYQEIDFPTQVENVTANIRDQIRLIANGIEQVNINDRVMQDSERSRRRAHEDHRDPYLMEEENPDLGPKHIIENTKDH